MSDAMKVQLTLELVDKAMGALKKLETTQKAINASNAAASNKANQNAAQVAKATKQTTDAINAQAKAEKAASAAASNAHQKRMAELARRKAAYADFERQEQLRKNAAREPFWKDYWADRYAQDAAKAAGAQKKVTEAVKQTGQEAARTEGRLRQMVRAVANAPWGTIGTAAGAAIGKAMGKAIGDNAKQAAMNAVKNIWGGIKGAVSGAGNSGLGLMSNAYASTRTGLNQAGVNAFSNVQGALDVENRLRPDLGSAEAAQAMRQYGDAWGKRAPFRTADTRAAMLELAPAGIDPRQNGLMDVLGDTAAANQQSLQSVASAWAAANRGDYSGIGTFGFSNVKTDGEGRSFVEAMVKGQMQKIVLDSEKAAETLEKLRAAMVGRYSGASGRAAITPNGMMIQMTNNWDAFTAKVMDAGPFAYVTDKLKEMLGYTETLGEKGLDAFADQIGGRIKQGLIEVEAKVRAIWDKLQSMASAVDPVVQAFGGWGNVVAALVALPFLGYASQVVMAVGMISSAIAMASRAFVMFGAAMMTTPIGWIVAGIAAIAAGAYLIYSNWETLGPWFSELWNTIKASFDNWKPLEAIQKAFEPVVQWVTSWGKTLYDAFDGAISKISNFVDGAWERISRVWANLKGAVSSVASTVGLGGGDTSGAGGALAQAQAAQEGVKTLERLKALLAEVQQAVAAFSLLPALQAAIGAAQGYLSGISFFSHGAAMMETLAQGMRARAEAAVAAVREVTQRMRDHLPHSPAKVGPLSDLHQIKFSETLAMGIHAGPAVSAVQNVVGQMRDAVVPVGISSETAMLGGRAAGSAGSGAGGSTTVHYAPVINGSGLDRQQLLDLLREHAHEAEKILAGQRRDNDRLAFGAA